MTVTDFKDIGWPAAFLGAVIVIAAALIIIAYIRALISK